MLCTQSAWHRASPKQACWRLHSLPLSPLSKPISLATNERNRQLTAKAKAPTSLHSVPPSTSPSKHLRVYLTRLPAFLRSSFGVLFAPSEVTTPFLVFIFCFKNIFINYLIIEIMYFANIHP